MDPPDNIEWLSLNVFTAQQEYSSLGYGWKQTKVFVDYSRLIR